jgi:PAS domain S-box-containing protein
VSQTDIHGVIQYASPSCKTLLGYELGELIGTSIFGYIHPDSLEEVKSAVETAFTEMTPGRMEVQFKHADGHYIWLEIAGSIFFNEKRLIKGAVFGSRDISERKNAERQIKRQYYVLDGINRIFRESLTSETEKEVSEVGLNVAEQLTGSKMSFIAEINGDRSLNGIAVSFSALKLYNASPSEIPKLITHMKISKYIKRGIKEEKSQIVNYSDFDPDKKGLPEGHPQINSFLCVPLKQGDKLIGLIALANKDGNYTFEDVENIESLSIAIVEALIGFKSKNKLKKYKNRLEETIGDLKRSNEELQRFAYVASHDLQEPLRTIASFTQLLERRYKGKLDGSADEFIDYIVEAALRMKEQIKGLLEYSRISTNENEFKNVNSEFILNQAIDNLQFAIKENNAEITYESMPVVMCDAGQLQRVFQNLISNAIKFKKEDVHPKIHISIKKDNKNQEYVFSVLDNGIGIEKQYMGRIFVIFQRLHTIDEYHGTGIGLSIVKRIIERHGGRIWVESKFGTGSAFYFTIPYSK